MRRRRRAVNSKSGAAKGTGLPDASERASLIGGFARDRRDVWHNAAGDRLRALAEGDSGMIAEVEDARVEPGLCRRTDSGTGQTGSRRSRE